MVDLLTETEARQRMRALLASRDWWVIPWVDLTVAGEVSTTIEAAAYTGEASADFLVMMGGPLPCSFARKTRLTRRQLAAALHDPGPLRRATAARLKTHDMLITFAAGADPTHIIARLVAWRDWLHPDDPEAEDD